MLSAKISDQPNFGYTFWSYILSAAFHHLRFIYVQFKESLFVFTVLVCSIISTNDLLVQFCNTVSDIRVINFVITKIDEIEVFQTC